MRNDSDNHGTTRCLDSSPDLSPAASACSPPSRGRVELAVARVDDPRCDGGGGGLVNTNLRTLGLSAMLLDVRDRPQSEYLNKAKTGEEALAHVSPCATCPPIRHWFG
jgi:hypothetical protein